MKRALENTFEAGFSIYYEARLNIYYEARFDIYYEACCDIYYRFNAPFNAAVILTNTSRFNVINCLRSFPVKA